MYSDKQSLYEGSISSINKKQRQAFKMVRSTFQPPEETQASYQYLDEKKPQASSLTLKGPKFSQKSIDKQIATSSFVPIPSLDIQDQNFHPNIQFIKSLRPINDEHHFEEGDCFQLDSEDRWLILAGQVKVIGVNGLSFNRGCGFIFFASPQTKKRIKQVIAVKSTKACKLSKQFFRDYIRNYLYVKNSQKIKYMKMSPFLVWNQSIAEDLAICMDLVDDLEKDEEIYCSGNQANYVYFVKEGIVLLERLGKAGNMVIKNYQKHYQNTQLSQQEGLLIVRKGMIFGIDGILIKQKNDEINLLNDPSYNQNYESNPQNIRPYGQKQESSQKSKLKVTRIYTAKSIGKCELYKLDKIVLQTYFKMSEYFNEHPEQLHMSQQELDRICAEYTNLIMGSNKIKKIVRKKEFVFEEKVDENAAKELEKKKMKVKEIKAHERKLKKISQNPVHNDRSYQHDKHTKQYQFLVKKAETSRQKKPLSPKKKLNKQISLPGLKKMVNHNIEGLILKKLQQKQFEEYMTYKKKVQKSLLQHEITEHHTEETKKKQLNLQCMKVKSYRSILSSLS